MERALVASRLIDYFRESAKPSSVLSPMYRKIVGTMADELEFHPNSDTTEWLVRVSADRSPLETSLLLTAGLHREVLLSSKLDRLSEYYPSVGGTKSFQNEEFAHVLLESVRVSTDKLAPIIRNDTVQTNETGRGLFWLFPSIVSGWDAIHLIDLGASAGLNLVADQRNFRLHATQQTHLSIGNAKEEQFVVPSRPFVPSLFRDKPPPKILSRFGCDLNPFPLRSNHDRIKLKSFVWADQLERMHRLDEAIAAHAKATIRLYRANLPDDLPAFLRSLPLGDDDDNDDVVIYNTYMTAYLRDEGRDLLPHIGDWARETKRRIMWVQSEPPRNDDAFLSGSPPEPSWCAWTVHLWEGNEQPKRWHLAWAHAHGKEIEWHAKGLGDFIAHFCECSSR